MSSLRSALEELGAEHLRHRSDEDLEEDYAELERAARVLQAEQSRRLAEIQRRETWRRDGFVSTVSWVASRFRTSFGVAMRRAREAAALEEMPAAREALKDGELSATALWVLVTAQEAHPEQFRSSEVALVDAARTVPARDLRRVVAYWRQAHDGPESLEEERGAGNGATSIFLPRSTGWFASMAISIPKRARP
jgi:uncharacterized protein DUF222